ncbi:MAG: hypothetical protein PUP91_20305 [Rhizonema sp. PD37]|nr:hypothetical protein [Rhizonema sp. PD37]
MAQPLRQEKRSVSPSEKTREIAALTQSPTQGNPPAALLTAPRLQRFSTYYKLSVISADVFSLLATDGDR